MKNMSIKIALAVVVALLSMGLGQPKAEARVINVTEDHLEGGRPHPTYVKHIQRQWHWVEMTDGSEWLVTRCRFEDSRNCWWNAKVRGNHEGRSFVDFLGRNYKVIPGTVVER